MCVAPVDIAVDGDFLDPLRKAMSHGNRDPLPAFGFFSILELALFELNDVEKNEDACILAKHTSQPRKVLSLRYAYDHVVVLRIDA